MQRRSNMELRNIRYFLAVAEELNFRRAAERLFITQPSLSAQLKKLEEEIDARLLDRDTHRVSLTAAGRSFAESGRRILRDVEDCARTVRRIARGEMGRLSVAFVPSLGHGLLPRIMRRYRRQFPQMELHLVEMDTPQQIEAIGDNRLDVGFIGLGIGTNTASDIKMETVVEERLMAVLPEDHPLLANGQRQLKSLRLSSLANERFVLAARHSAPLYNPWVILLCQQAGFQPQVIQETGQPVTVLNYVAAGIGVSILPAQFSRLSTAGVRFLPLSHPVPLYRYCAAWSKRNEHSALRHIVRVAHEVVALTSQT